MPFDALSDPDLQKEYLSHHGIKGQKWGIRRFQNEDGSLTAEGKSRYGQAEGSEKKQGIGKKAGQAIGRGIKNLAGKAKDRIGEAVDNKIKEHRPSKMTDEELRQKLNRLQMEKQYKQLKREMEAMDHPQKQKKEHTMLKSLVNQVFVATAMRTLSTIVRKEMETRVDDFLAPKRAARDLERSKSVYQGKHQGYTRVDDPFEDYRYFKSGKEGKKKKD